MQYNRKRVTIMGLGHFGGGVGAARFLARCGAKVTVTDLADERTLVDAVESLADVPIDAWHLGGHQADDFRFADLIVVNPAVRPENEFLKIAVEADVPRTSEIELFLEACPAMTVGVTGSNGKSTTAAMLASILRAEGRTVWLGGNIGGSLLDKLDAIDATDSVVLELSSFQLYHMSAGLRMPHVAIVTGCTPNHLDWHTDWDSYVASKRRLLMGQTAEDLFVLNSADPVVDGWGSIARGRRLPIFSEADLPELPVDGRHHRTNARLAATAAVGLGCSSDVVRRGLSHFEGLPQRLECVAEVEGRRFVNDSASTTPESTIAALHSLDRPVWLLAGGRDKGCEFQRLAETIGQFAQGAALFGEVRENLADEITRAHATLPCHITDSLNDAFDWCVERSVSGDTILFSPGCASGPPFRNYRHRGEQFVALVRRFVKQHDR